MRDKKGIRQSGFSLIELIVVILLVSIISVFALSRLLSNKDAGAAEQNLQEAATRINQKRDEAIRLNGNRARTSLENEVAPLVVIDFASLSTTAGLITDGIDLNNDRRDDDTGELLTYVSGGNWVYSYRNDAMVLRGDWRVATSVEDIPGGLISQHGQGDYVTKIGFDADGRAYGWQNGAWQKYPANRGTSGGSTGTSSFFWAVYLVSTNSQGRQAVAVAVYPSGQTEKFRYDGSSWLGFRSRQIPQ